MLRSESRLAIELPDFFTIPLPNEGPTACFPMMMIMIMIMNMNNGVEEVELMRQRGCGSEASYHYYQLYKLLNRQKKNT